MKHPCQLPTKAYEAIDRWYAITCAAFAITLLSLLGLSMYMYSVTQSCNNEYQSLLVQAQEYSEDSSKNYLVRKYEKIQKNREHLAEDLKLLARVTPQSVRITSYAYQSKGQRSISGTGSSAEAVQQMTMALAKEPRWKKVVVKELLHNSQERVVFSLAA